MKEHSRWADVGRVECNGVELEEAIFLGISQQELTRADSFELFKVCCLYMTFQIFYALNFFWSRFLKIQWDL